MTTIKGEPGDLVTFDPHVEVNVSPWGEYGPEQDPRPGENVFTVSLGTGTPVVIDKAYGPLVMAGLRITADYATCEWVIEREWIADGSWHEIARIAGQVDEEFRDDDES